MSNDPLRDRAIDEAYRRDVERMHDSARPRLDEARQDDFAEVRDAIREAYLGHPRAPDLVSGTSLSLDRIEKALRVERERAERAVEALRELTEALAASDKPSRSEWIKIRQAHAKARAVLAEQEKP